MILLLNTSTPTCCLSLIDGNWRQDYEWLAARSLAKGLLGFLNEKLVENGKNWADITAIGVFEGPGSFTGLRIGITVMNTIADAQSVPIVGGQGDNWQQQVITKLQSGQNDKIVLPFYGSEAKITVAKK
jgi:tRNA threonylcarbamoyladenosine biosynthesis protein TsaB